MRAAVGLGANLGSRLAAMRAALALLEGTEPAGAITIEACSRLYASDAVGPGRQPPFLNAAARVRTALAPQALLARLLEVEAALGRVRAERWGPRAIDLDVLWAEGIALESASLTIPHPHLAERPFALAPLIDVVPALGATLGPVLAELGGAPAVLPFELCVAHDAPSAPPERVAHDLVEARGPDRLDALAALATALAGRAWRAGSGGPALAARDEAPRLEVHRADALDASPLALVHAALRARAARRLDVHAVVLGADARTLWIVGRRAALEPPAEGRIDAVETGDRGAVSWARARVSEGPKRL